MLVTSFGMCNSPTTFQSYINHVLHDLDNYCTAYDVLVFPKTREEHTVMSMGSFVDMGEAGLQIDVNKSEFYTTMTKDLGLIISTDGVSMDKRSPLSLPG